MPAPTSKRDAQVRLVRKLLKLAKSPNKHEAARALEEARRLMAKHGLAKEEVSEVVVEAVDNRVDQNRVWLASFIAAFHGCSVVGHKREGMGIRGPQERARSVVEMYRRAIAENEQSVMVPIAPWFQEQSRIVWDFWWWDGFAEVMRERFPAPPPPPPKDVPIPQSSGETPPAAEPAAEFEPEQGDAPAVADEDPIEQVRQVVRAIGYNIDMRWVERHAKQSGRDAARRMSVLSSSIALAAGTNT